METSNVTPEALAAVQAVQLELTGENATALSLRRPFDPVAHDLDSSFRLTRYADLKGWGCKVPQDVLLKLLEGLQDDANIQDHEQNQYLHFPYTKIGIFNIPDTPCCHHQHCLCYCWQSWHFLCPGIGMDASVTPLRHGGLSLVQTTDFFYPLVDDPYMQGIDLTGTLKCIYTSVKLAGKIAAANVLSDMYAMGVTECDNMLMLLGVSTKMTEKERDIVMPLLMRGFKVNSWLIMKLLSNHPWFFHILN